MNKEFFEWLSQFTVPEREIESDYNRYYEYKYYYIAWGTSIDTFLTGTKYHWSSRNNLPKIIRKG